MYNTDEQLTAEAVIHHPPATVWALLSDYRRDPEWRAGVIEMTPSASPVRPGTETVEVMRFGGRTYRNVGVVDTVSEHALTWHTTEGVDASGQRSAEPAGTHATRVRLELTVRPKGFERMLAPLLRRMLQRNLEGDLTRLAELLDRSSQVTGRHVLVG
jgi:uncharacterized protein YndB with AHSA1/START domain